MRLRPGRRQKLRKRRKAETERDSGFSQRSALRQKKGEAFVRLPLFIINSKKTPSSVHKLNS